VCMHFGRFDWLSTLEVGEKWVPCVSEGPAYTTVTNLDRWSAE